MEITFFIIIETDNSLNCFVKLNDLIISTKLYWSIIIPAATVSFVPASINIRLPVMLFFL